MHFLMLRRQFKSTEQILRNEELCLKMNQLFSLQLWTNSRAVFFNLGMTTSLREGKLRLKPVNILLNIDLVSHQAHVDGLLNTNIMPVVECLQNKSHNIKHRCSVCTSECLYS